jgi:hypothetical protein
MSTYQVYVSSCNKQGFLLLRKRYPTWEEANRAAAKKRDVGYHAGVQTSKGGTNGPLHHR